MPVISATGSRGFTLLELLVVLSIMVLLAGAWPFAAARLFPNQQLRSEGQRLMGALREARMNARMAGVARTVELLSAGDGYQTGSVLHTLPSGIIAQLRDQQSPTIPADLKFFPDGSSTGGVIDLTLSTHVLSVQV